MVKKYVNLGIVYAIAAMVFGVFYREFTKALAFTGQTNLSFMHTHYFVLGMFFFLILALMQKNFGFTDKRVNLFVILYQVGLNITGIGFLARGLVQILVTDLSKGLNAAISGVSGIGHIVMSVGLIFILIKIKKCADENKAEKAENSDKK